MPLHEQVLPGLSGYEVLEEIARGGMGIVYKARQISLDRMVALKVIIAGAGASKEFIHRFRTEAAAAAHLHHPNIVAVHEVGSHRGENYLVMDYVNGANLSHFVGQQPLPAERAARYVKTIAEAIHYAHERGILHRDLKPSNVLIDSVTDQPRVTDFGLAKRLNDEHPTQLTLTGQVLGSPNFMAPEQSVGAKGKVSRRTDVYGLGSILYHALTARPPFQSDSLQDLLKQVAEVEPVSPALLNKNVPRDLETICLKCLEKEPIRRYATAHEVAEELDRFLRGVPILARPVGRAERTWRWCVRNPMLASMGSALLVALLTVAIGSPIAVVQISRSRGQARREATASRQSLYAADMRLAQESYNDGNVRRAMELLSRHVPGLGEEDLRGFEWRYLWRLCHKGDAEITFDDHTAAVTSIDWLPNNLLAAATPDGSVHIYDLQRQNRIARIQIGGASPSNLDPDLDPHLLPLSGALAFCRETASLAAGDAQGLVQIWSIDPFEKVQSREFDGSISALAFSSNGKLLAVSVREQGLMIWSIAEDRLMEPFPVSERPAIRMTFSPDGAFLVAGGNAMPVRIWTVPGFAPTNGIVEPHSGFSTGVALSPDGRILATASWDTMIKLWDPTSRTLLATLKGHLSHVWDLAISPNGRLLASASSDGTVKLWRLDEPFAPQMSAWRSLRGHTAPVISVRFSFDGSLLASGSADHTSKIWKVDSDPASDILSGHQDWVYSAAIHANGRKLATASFDGTVRIWGGEDLLTTAILKGHANNVFEAAFTPDGRRIVTCDAVWRVNENRDFTTPGTIKLWDTDTGLLLATLREFTTGVRAIAISPRGSLLATGDHDGAVRLWNIETMPPIPVQSLAEANVVRGSPDPTGQIRRLQFSRDGQRLGVLRHAHSAEVWSLNPVRLLRTFPGKEDWNYALALSPDGRQLAGGGEEVKIWDIETGKLLASLEGHQAPILSAAFSPDGGALATGSVDHSIKLWNLSIRREVATLIGHEGPVSDVTFSEDGNLLVSSSEDLTARLWRAATLDGAKGAATLRPFGADK